MKFLVLWEFAKKRDYIFKSNKLIEAVGASLIIKKLTEDFSNYKLEEEKFIIKAGGKTLYAFDSLTEAKEFNKNFSIEVIRNYPGLELFMVIESFDEEKEDVREVIEKIYTVLEKKKMTKKNCCHQLSFGIERPCNSTATVANFYDKEKKDYISKEIRIKRTFGRDNQNESFKEFIPRNYKLETTIDNLIGNNEKNYIGVVHIDGNSMGKKFKDLKEKITPKSSESKVDFNKRYIKVLKNFSEKIKEAYEEAFLFMTEAIEENKEKLKKNTAMEKGYFPVRPLILAGDDITYVSNGFIAIETARIFIETLNEIEIKIEEINLGKLNAAAGISLVKRGYPFIKAYEMAEQLCSNAKKQLIDQSGEKREYSILDFHVAQGEIASTIEEIREKDYSLEGEKEILNMRPLLINSDENWRTYKNFIESIENIEKALKENSIGRNKIKELRREIKKGREATEHFFKFYNIEPGKYLRPLGGLSNQTLGDYTFNEKDGRSMYLDAIEVMDLFIKLD